MVSQTYSYDPYSGTLTTTDPATGIVVVRQTSVLPTGKIQQTQTSYTPAQWEIRKQIKESGATLTPEAETQIAEGLQQQTKQALAGEEPQPFQVRTPEATFTATGGITPESMRGTTGSVLKRGYQTVGGKEVPISQRFKTESGQEFEATPLKRTGRAETWMREEEWLWQTPYGQISAEPRHLQKEIERKLSIDAFSSQLPSLQEKIALEQKVKAEAHTLPARFEFAIEHPTKGLEYMIGSTLIHGDPFAEEGIEKFSKEREDWMRAVLKTDPIKVDFTKPGWITQYIESDRGKMALRGMVEPVSLVAGGKLFSMIPGGMEKIAGTEFGKTILGHALTKPILTGAGLGLTGGITAIGTIETVEAVRSKDEQRAGRGVLLAGAGAMGMKYVYEAGVYSELIKAFPPKMKSAGITISDIQMKDVSKKEIFGTGEAGFKTKTMGKEVITKAEYQFVAKGFDDKFSVSLGRGHQVSGTIESGKFVKLDEKYFADISATKKLSDSFLGSIFQATDDVIGAGFSEKMTETPFITTFKTISVGHAGKKEFVVATADVVRDMTKFPISGGAPSGGLDVKLDFDKKGLVDVITKDMFKLHGEDVGKAIIPKADAPIIALPGLGAKSKKVDVDLGKGVITDIKISPIKDLESSVSPASGSGAGLIGTTKIDFGKDLFRPNIPSFDFGFKEAGLQDVAVGQAQLTGMEQITTFSVPNPTITPVSPDIHIPGGVPIGLPDFGFKESRRRGKVRGAVRGYAYMPSFTALAFNIRSTRMPKILTGLEIRPIITRRRRRRK